MAFTNDAGRWLTKNSDVDCPISRRTQQNTVNQESAISGPWLLVVLLPSTPLSKGSFAPHHASSALQSLMRPKSYVVNTSCLPYLNVRITHANAIINIPPHTSPHADVWSLPSDDKWLKSWMKCPGRDKAVSIA